MLPKSCVVVATEPHGVSFWANTGRIDVVLSNGQDHSFFIKVISGPVGKNMMQSEYESTKSIYEVQVSFVPKPIAWGTYESNTDTHFYLCEYREMTGEVPEPRKFTQHLAALHQDSVSPDGKFGFHMTTYMVNLPQLTDKETSWEVYFRNC